MDYCEILIRCIPIIPLIMCAIICLIPEEEDENKRMK